jgi:hypothetical protein
MDSNPDAIGHGSARSTEILQLVPGYLMAPAGQALDPQDSDEEPSNVPLEETAQLPGSLAPAQEPIALGSLKFELAVELSQKTRNFGFAHRPAVILVGPTQVGNEPTDFTEIVGIGIGKVAKRNAPGL